MSRSSDKPQKEQKEVKKVTYTVILDGVDRTILATDEKDLQKQIEKLRS